MVIILDSSRPKDKYYFTYGGWIAKDEGDGRLWRDIAAKKSLPKELMHGNKTKYQITVKTGDVKYSGTDANVFIQMVGPLGTTPKLKLDDAKNNFERNMVDNFDVEAVNVGSLDHIVVGHDNFGAGPGWFLEKVNIRRYLPREEVVERLKNMKKRLNKRRKLKGGKLEKGDGEDSDDEYYQQQRELRGKDRRRRKEEKKAKKLKGNFFKGSSSSSSSSSSSDSDDDSRRESVSSASRRLRSSSGSRPVSIHSGSKSRRASSARGARRTSTSASGLGMRDQVYGDDDDRAVTEMKVPQYEEYMIVCNRWLAKDEDDGLFVREFPITKKTTYFKD